MKGCEMGKKWGKTRRKNEDVREKKKETKNINKCIRQSGHLATQNTAGVFFLSGKSYKLIQKH